MNSKLIAPGVGLVDELFVTKLQTFLRALAKLIP
jgi:hypothetical protein